MTMNLLEVMKNKVEAKRDYHKRHFNALYLEPVKLNLPLNNMPVYDYTVKIREAVEAQLEGLGVAKHELSDLIDTHYGLVVYEYLIDCIEYHNAKFPGMKIEPNPFLPLGHSLLAHSVGFEPDLRDYLEGHKAFTGEVNEALTTAYRKLKGKELELADTQLLDVVRMNPYVDRKELEKVLEESHSAALHVVCRNIQLLLDLHYKKPDVNERGYTGFIKTMLKGYAKLDDKGEYDIIHPLPYVAKRNTIGKLFGHLKGD